MSSSDIHRLVKRCQRLGERYADLLSRHQYLKEQLTSCEQKLLSKPTETHQALSHQEQKQLEAIEQSLKQLQNDRWLDELFSVAQNERQVEEIKRLMVRWGIGNPVQPFDNPAHCIIWHANKHGDGKILKYMRQANNFNKRRAKSKWVEGAKKWTRKSGEYLIERDGKIVSYEKS